MEDVTNIIEEIKKSFNNKEYDIMDKYINQLFKKSGSKIIDYVNNIDLPEKDKLMFFMRASASKNIFSGLSQDVFFPYIPKYINNNSDKFLIWLNDKEFQNELIIWLKQNVRVDDIKEEILTKILEIPQVQQKFLCDPEIFKQKHSYNFYNSLPQEYGFLVFFYVNYDIEEYEKELENLYNKYFSNILADIDKLKFIKEQIKISQKEDIFNLGYLNSFYEFSYISYVLKKISKNNGFYKIFQNFIKVSNLSIEEISKFIYKYEDAPFLFKLLSKPFLDENTIAKIRYLSFENRLVDYNTVENLDNVSLRELKNSTKEKNTNIKLKIYGGPTGSTKEKFFLDGYETEIRRINYDGSIEVVDAEEGHDLAIELAYPEIKFDDNCVMAGERAAEASKQLSCITLMIENESCLVVANKNISDEQIEALKNLKLVDENNAKFGIFEVNEENNDLIPVYLEDVDFYKMIEYMESLNKKKKSIVK